MKDILAFIGAVAVIASIGAIVLILWELIMYIFRNIMWSYKYKHRFDKEPTAKCFCTDCSSFASYKSYCNRFNHYTADSDFCSLAVPWKHDPELKEN